ncbi:MAG: trigger factor [Phycisphaerae bacterium]|nr:trigger factor [Phycisphaerae bacterium]
MSQTTEQRPNTVTISDAGPSRKKLSIQIPAETVSERLRESLDALMGEAQLPGFRKGKAPRSLVERRFGPAVRDEAKRDLVSKAFSKAVEDHKLQVVGDPTSETLDKVELKDGQPLDIELDVEVMPVFELPNLDGIDVKKPTMSVTDDMVDEEIKKAQINDGRLESREAPEPGDYLTGRGIMVGADGTEFYNINGAVVQVPPADRNGKGMILGVMVDDFSAQLGLPKPGETATIKVRGPENHEVEGIRNADLTVTFTVERVDRIIPATIEQIVTQYGWPGVEQLREAVRMRLNQRVLVQQATAMRQQVAQYLLDNTTMDLPERMTAIQAARTLQRQRLELMYRGMDTTAIEERMAELRNASASIARSELKLFFILQRAADDLKITVSEAEMNGRIAAIAAERNVRPEALRQELIQRNQIGGIFQQIREHKTFDAILSKATITEMPAEAFNTAMAEAAKARAAKA